MHNKKYGTKFEVDKKSYLETSETSIHLAVLSLNLWKKLRLLLCALLQRWLAGYGNFRFAEL